MRRATFLIFVGVFFLGGGIVVAKRLYPAEFDWRYMTLSTLLSPLRNPGGYLWAVGWGRPEQRMCSGLGCRITP
jgi:hypothetical protein